MGACATKPGDLKVKGEAPLVMDDAAEKKYSGSVVETDPAADGTRRRSLSDLLKENADSDVEVPETKKAEPATAAADDTGATEEQLTVQPSIATYEQDHTAEERGAKAAQDPHTHTPVVEEEKRVDPDSVQAALVPAQSVEESKVVADASV